MEQFSLEKYLENPNRKIVTRDGRKVRIICTDAKFEKYQVLALITKKDGQEMLATLDTSGKFRGGYDSHLDLFFASEKHEGWVNIYLDADNSSYVGTCIYKSKEESEESGKKWSCYITTVKVEWEE